MRLPNGMVGTGGVWGSSRYPQIPLKRYSFRGPGLRGFRGAVPYYGRRNLRRADDLTESSIGFAISDGRFCQIIIGNRVPTPMCLE